MPCMLAFSAVVQVWRLQSVTGQKDASPLVRAAWMEGHFHSDRGGDKLPVSVSFGLHAWGKAAPEQKGGCVSEDALCTSHEF